MRKCEREDRRHQSSIPMALHGVLGLGGSYLELYEFRSKTSFFISVGKLCRVGYVPVHRVTPLSSAQG